MFKNISPISTLFVPIGSNFKKSDVDQYPNQKFNLGQNGFVENDITLVSRATSLEQLKRISLRLQEIPKNNPDNSKKSVFDIKREIIDRQSQTPSELVRAQEYILNQIKESARPLDVPAPADGAVPADGAAPADGSAPADGAA